MDMFSALQGEGGIGAIARELGVDEGTAQTGVQALLPSVLGGMQNQAQASPQGIGGLASILGGLGGGGLLSSVLAPQPSNVGAGNDVLGHIFGGKDTSRAVAADAAGRTGLSPDLLKKMLPLVAMLAAGYFAKHAGGGSPQGGSPQGGLGGGLGSVLGGALGGGGMGNAGGGLGGLLGGLLGGGQQGGGNPLNDILGV